MLIRKFLVVALSFTFALPALAQARDEKGPDGHRMMGPSFEEMDRNEDGKLTMDEMRAFHERKMQKMFQEMDSNHDKAVTKKEMDKAHERWMSKGKMKGKKGMGGFDRMDTNKDGNISRSEFESAHKMRMEEHDKMMNEKPQH